MNSLLRYPWSKYLSECDFETARSGGKGGQHVNKTESKVTLVFNLQETKLFTEDEKSRLRIKLKSHLADQNIRVVEERSRSQIKNKKEVIDHFFELLEKALVVKPKRIPTKVSVAKKKARVDAKKKISEKKRNRSRPKFD